LEALDTEKTRVEIISSAGGTGWLAVSYDAHGAFVRDVRNFFIANGFELENENEISYLDMDKPSFNSVVIRARANDLECSFCLTPKLL
jgi:hypothetical protein